MTNTQESTVANKSGRRSGRHLDLIIGEYFMRRDRPIPARLLRYFWDFVFLFGGFKFLNKFTRRYKPDVFGSTDEDPMTDALMEVQYDLPMGLFNVILEPDMPKYSAGLLGTTENPSLAKMTDNFYRDMAEKTGLQSGMRVLDIGCGYGSAGIWLKRNFPECEYVGVNPSRVGIENCRHLLPDGIFHEDTLESFCNRYNGDPFDRVISVGVWEHIRALGPALRQSAPLVKPDGYLFLHYIVSRRSKSFTSPRSFVGKYIFPGGCTHSFDEMSEEAARTDVPFSLEQSWFIHGRNYRATIEHWLERFERDLALLHQIMDPPSVRMFHQYLIIARSFFIRGGTYGNGQFLLKPE